MNAALIWLAVGIVIMALEAVVPGFVIFWFGAGSVITALVVFLGADPTGALAWSVFFLTSFLLLILWHIYFKRFFGTAVTDDRRDPTLTSLRGRVVEEILPHKPGEVELYQLFHSIKKWKAESDTKIEQGEEVEVIEANGIRLIVKKV